MIPCTIQLSQFYTCTNLLTMPTCNKLKIVSMNCRGLGDLCKRKDVFNYLRDKSASIYCIQDTHFTPNMEKIIQMQWGYEMVSSYGTSNSRGVSILFNNNFEYKLLECNSDKEGNYIMINIEVEHKFTVTILNIYGPNQDNPNFYIDLKNKLDNSLTDYIIVCGDFNLVLDFDLDCDNYVQQNNLRAAKEVQTLKGELSLEDPWRIHNPNSKKYTWVRRNPLKRARLDFFLVSESLLNIIEKTQILPGYRTDHSLINLEIKISNFESGKGFWKFNNALLKDKLYVQKVKNVILHTKFDYAVPVYNYQHLDQIKEMDLEFTIDDQLFLDTLLMKIRAMTIPYAAEQKRNQIKQKLELENQIKNIDEKISKENNTSNYLYNKLEELKSELETIRQHELKGLLLRTKCRWIEHGEKPTRYFSTLEKRNFTNENLIKIIKDDGSCLVKQKDILNEIKVFYENLYKNQDNLLEDVNLEEILGQFQVNKLRVEDKIELEKPLDISEVGRGVSSLKNEKSPGPDGFSAEFFKFFWPDLKFFLLR